MDRIDWELEQQEKSQKVINDFGSLVNNFNFDAKPFIEAFTREHRTLQQSMFRTIIELVCFMASDEYRTDGRNEQSKEMAKMLVRGYAEAMKEKELKCLVRAGYDNETAEIKAEEYKNQILVDPKRFMRLSCV